MRNNDKNIDFIKLFLTVLIKNLSFIYFSRNKK